MTDDIDDLPPVNDGDEHKTYEEFAHGMWDKKKAELSTEVKNPEALTTLDTAMIGLIADEFKGTGLDKDLKTFIARKDIRWIAKDRKRETGVIAIASAAAQKEEAKAAFREKLLGSLDR